MAKKITTNKKEFNINVWLDEDLYIKAKNYAEKYDVSLSKLSRIAIRKLINSAIELR